MHIAPPGGYLISPPPLPSSLHSIRDLVNYFQSSIYTMEIAPTPPQWTVNIENWLIGGYFHSNILFAIPMCIIHRDTIARHYVTMSN